MGEPGLAPPHGDLLLRPPLAGPPGGLRGVRGRRQHARPDQVQEAELSRRHARRGHPDRVGPSLRPRAGPRPPRREAGQRHDHERRPGEGHGLRPGARATAARDHLGRPHAAREGRRYPQRGRRGRRDPGLHVPRAGGRPRLDPPLRSLELGPLDPRDVRRPPRLGMGRDRPGRARGAPGVAGSPGHRRDARPRDRPAAALLPREPRGAPAHAARRRRRHARSLRGGHRAAVPPPRAAHRPAHARRPQQPRGLAPRPGTRRRSGFSLEGRAGGRTPARRGHLQRVADRLDLRAARRRGVAAPDGRGARDPRRSAPGPPPGGPAAPGPRRSGPRHPLPRRGGASRPRLARPGPGPRRGPRGGVLRRRRDARPGALPEPAGGGLGGSGGRGRIRAGPEAPRPGGQGRALLRAGRRAEPRPASRSGFRPRGLPARLPDDPVAQGPRGLGHGPRGLPGRLARARRPRPRGARVGCRDGRIGPRLLPGRGPGTRPRDHAGRALPALGGRERRDAGLGHRGRARGPHVAAAHRLRHRDRPRPRRPARGHWGLRPHRAPVEHRVRSMPAHHGGPRGRGAVRGHGRDAGGLGEPRRNGARVGRGQRALPRRARGPQGPGERGRSFRGAVPPRLRGRRPHGARVGPQLPRAGPRPVRSHPARHVPGLGTLGRPRVVGRARQHGAGVGPRPRAAPLARPPRRRRAHPGPRAGRPPVGRPRQLDQRPPPVRAAPAAPRPRASRLRGRGGAARGIVQGPDRRGPPLLRGRRSPAGCRSRPRGPGHPRPRAGGHGPGPLGRAVRAPAPQRPLGRVGGEQARRAHGPGARGGRERRRRTRPFRGHGPVGPGVGSHEAAGRGRPGRP